MTEEILEIVLHELQVENDFELACFQPKFIIDQVVSACKYQGVAPNFTNELVTDALKNLYTSGAKEAAKTAAKSIGS